MVTSIGNNWIVGAERWQMVYGSELYSLSNSDPGFKMRKSVMIVTCITILMDWRLYMRIGFLRYYLSLCLSFDIYMHLHSPSVGTKNVLQRNNFWKPEWVRLLEEEIEKDPNNATLEWFVKVSLIISLVWSCVFKIQISFSNQEEIPEMIASK